MLEDIRLAFQGIWNHKLRSALTMLGIIIGIGSIIAIVSTIKGTNEQIKKNLVGAGNDAVNVQLYQGDWPIDLQYQSLPDGVPEISDETLQEVVELPEVETASLYHTRNEYDAVYRGAKSLSNSVILGIDRNYLDVYGYQVIKGRGLTDKDYSEGRKEALIDSGKFIRQCRCDRKNDRDQGRAFCCRWNGCKESRVPAGNQLNGRLLPLHVR